KILAEGPARIYFACHDPNSWSYGGLQGALVFVRDKARGILFLRLVDVVGTREMLWELEVYADFEYWQDRLYIHSLAGDECNIGIVFAEENEAKNVSKKIISRKESKLAVAAAPSTAPSVSRSKTKKGGKINKSLMSGPAQVSFLHVTHMGYAAERGSGPTGVDCSWKALLGDHEAHGVDEQRIQENMDYIKDFVRDAQKAPKPPAPRRSELPAPPPPRNAPPARSESSAPPPSVIISRPQNICGPTIVA
ncbi:hypothetical protein PENSPDRAFT_578277, partial [Peniophora sp. CONT]